MFKKYIYTSFHSMCIPPLIYYVSSLLFGIIIWHLQIPFIIPTSIVLGILICTTSLLKTNTPFMKNILLFFMTGIIIVAIPKQSYNKLIYKESISITGIIKDITPMEHQRFKYRMALDAFKYKIKNDEYKINDILYLYFTHNPHLLVSDTITFNDVKITETPQKTLYYAKENISGLIYIEKIWFILQHRPWLSLQRWISNTKIRLINKKNEMNNDTLTLFSSLFFGNKQPVKVNLGKLRPNFQKWGLAHVLARSGLHLILFILIWKLLLNLIPLPFFIKHIIILLFGSLYALLSWTSVSFMRAWYLFILYKICTFLHFPFYALHLLAFACFIILIMQPLHCFFLDFQLSFLLTFCLSWVNEIKRKPHIMF